MSDSSSCLKATSQSLTTDTELKYTQSGAATARFTVAVSYWIKRNGECYEVNDGFFRCSAWRAVAENAAQTLQKGMSVLVRGKQVQRTWEADDGNKRS